MPKTSTPRAPRRLSPLKGAVAGVIALPVAAAAFMGLSAQNTLANNIQHKNLMPANAVAQKVTDGQPVNVLFLTQRTSADGSPLEAGFVAHISADRERVDLVHIPRDLVLPQSGTQFDDTYAQGGAPKVVEAVNELLGITIQHVAVTDIEGLRDTVDSLNGVTVPGTGHMNGTQALNWIGAEEGQGVREMALTKAVVAKGLSNGTLMSPKKAMRFLDAATTDVKVDDGLTNTELVRLGMSLRGVKAKDVHSVTVPWTGATGTGDAKEVNPDMAKISELAKDLANDTMSAYDTSATDNATVKTPR